MKINGGHGRRRRNAARAQSHRHLLFLTSYMVNLVENTACMYDVAAKLLFDGGLFFFVQIEKKNRRVVHKSPHASLIWRAEKYEHKASEP